MPDAGFSPTISWEAGQLVFDNRAIELPQDTPPGEYQIWVRPYQTDSGQQLEVSGGESYEATTAILTTRIQVVSGD